MNRYVSKFLGLFVRLLVVAAGLVLAASLVLVALALACGWALYAGWARLTGRRVNPFVMHVDPRRGFAAMRARAAQASAGRGSAAGGGHARSRAAADVIDVEPRLPRE